MLPDLRFDGATATADVDTSVYSLLALKKAAYRLADRCSVMFGTQAGNSITVSFVASVGTAETEIRECVRAFLDEALDQDLRERISRETEPLRNLILAHAFSRTKLVPGADGQLSGTCVECQTDLQCKSPMHCASGTCTVPRLCSSSLTCMGRTDGRVVCDPTSSECVECVGDSDCGQGKTCTAAHVCAIACNGNVDCASAGPFLSCDTGQKICVECLDATQCAANQYCELGRCVEDACVSGAQTCSANAIYQCNDSGDTVTKVTACDLAICTETGTTAVCDQLPDAGSRCPDTSTCSCPPFISGCCTVDFKCGCVGISACQ